MKIEKVKNNDPELSLDKVQATVTKIVALLQKQKLTVGEILIVLGNVIYTVGASIGSYKVGPSAQELEKKYAINPSVDVALMLTGLHVTSWVDSLGKTVEDFKK